MLEVDELEPMLMLPMLPVVMEPEPPAVGVMVTAEVCSPETVPDDMEKVMGSVLVAEPED